MRLTDSLAAIRRVPGIERPSIGADLGAVSMQVDSVLHAHMAVIAERLQRTESEGVPVATMGGHMVSDGGWGHDVSLDAERAKWLMLQL
jgi:hypothetical protein